jgi:cytochrome oxidase Cu insertion factor (SCO1/SenC/PrrC family)
MKLSNILTPRVKFVLMFILFALPITASYLMFFFWKPKTTNNFGELITPVVAMPQEKFLITDGKDAPQNVLDKGLRGKWLMVTRDSGACDQACAKKLYTMRQARLILSKELDRVVRVVLIDDATPMSPQIQQDFAGAAFVAAKDSAWLAKLPREANDATNGRGYIYAIDPMGNLFMRYKADEDIKELAADFRRVLKASQLGKDFEDK